MRSESWWANSPLTSHSSDPGRAAVRFVQPRTQRAAPGREPLEEEITVRGVVRRCRRYSFASGGDTEGARRGFDEVTLGGAGRFGNGDENGIGIGHPEAGAGEDPASPLATP